MTNMHRILLLITTSVIVVSIPIIMMIKFKSDFCNGWSEGYKEGWCYQKENCIAPIVPICPPSKIGETTYKDGYNMGFTQGKKKKEEINFANN